MPSDKRKDDGIVKKSEFVTSNTNYGGNSEHFWTTHISGFCDFVTKKNFDGTGSVLKPF